MYFNIVNICNLDNIVNICNLDNLSSFLCVFIYFRLVSFLFSLHHSQKSDKLAKLNKVEEMQKKEYKKCLEQAHGDNVKVLTFYIHLTVFVMHVCTVEYLF